MNEIYPSEINSEIQSLPMVGTGSLVLDEKNIELIMNFGAMMSRGRSTIPSHLQNNPSDCAAIVMQAMQWRMNPWAVAQKTHLINGVLGYEAQLVNAVIQSSGVTTGRFNYIYFGEWEKIIGKTKIVKETGRDNKPYEKRVPDYSPADETGLGVVVSATLRGEDEPRVLDLLLVQAVVRNSPLWAANPKQQLAYLAVKMWSRLFTPDIILGVNTPDELEHMIERDITPSRPARPGRPDPVALAEQAREKENAAAAAAGESALDGEKLEGVMLDLEAVADEGTAALEHAWQAIGKANRKQIGSEFLNSLRARAGAADARQAGAGPVAGLGAAGGAAGGPGAASDLSA